MKKKLYVIIGCFIIILGWILTYFIVNNPLIIPSPIDVFNSLIELFKSKSVFIDIYQTLYRTIISFIISYIIGLIFATIASKSNKIEDIFKPLFTCLRAIPTVSFIIIFIMIIGFKRAPYYIVFIISFPIIYQAILEGYKNINPELKLINKLDNYNPIKNYLLFTFPMIKTSLITAFISSFTLSFKVEVMAETLTGSTRLKGLGFLIHIYRYENDISMILAIALLIVILSSLFEILGKLVLKLIKE